MKKRARGFSLIETMLAVLIIGICVTPISILIINVMSQNIHTQALATAASLAEARLEDVLSMRFSAVNNTTPAVFTQPFGAYSWRVVSDYVDAGNLNSPVAGPTDYKRVQVIVNSSIAGEAGLVTLITRDW